MTRIAVLDADRCKPKKCNQMCIKYCPMVRSRVEAIRFEEKNLLNQRFFDPFPQELARITDSCRLRDYEPLKRQI